ncbi:MAG: A/G-specific adenine glycosylase, partial [Limisphaerales bacterium]
MKHRELITRLVAWFAETARDLPWRRTGDPYGIWVSEVMLQQTQVKTVIPYWERWMRELPTIASLAKSKSEKIHKLWEGLGYYHRVRNMQRAAQLIVREHGGRFPMEFDEVLKLPGIGRYTAGAICSIAFGQPRPILDGNVIRVLTRVFGIAGDPGESETKAKLWSLAEDLVREAPKLTNRCPPCPALPSAAGKAVPTIYPAMVRSKRRVLLLEYALQSSSVRAAPHAASHFNQALMELGALVCSPREPKCPVCPLANGCVAFRDGRVSQLPMKG